MVGYVSETVWAKKVDNVDRNSDFWRGCLLGGGGQMLKSSLIFMVIARRQIETAAK